MLNRRFIRIKVLQALYAYYSRQDEIGKSEKELLDSFNRIYDLYLLMMYSMVEIREFALQNIEDGKKKRLPSADDLNPNLRFVENSFLKGLFDYDTLRYEVEKRKLGWGDQREVLRSIWREFKLTEDYLKYMEKSEGEELEDLIVVTKLYAEHVAVNESLHDYLEERSMHWSTDLAHINSTIVKNIESSFEKKKIELEPLFRDVEDRDFGVDLLRKTANHDGHFEKMIIERTHNWDKDRIAMMDMIIMKMALAELLYMETVPVKVTLNEYIELSKQFSTKKSKEFVNGVLDKMVVEMRASGEIRKVGRGLID